MGKVNHTMQLILILIGAILILELTSCYTTGYGCRGKSRSMTGEGMWKRGSRLN